jgi:hypothetical protein
MLDDNMLEFALNEAEEVEGETYTPNEAEEVEGETSRGGSHTPENGCFVIKGCLSTYTSQI